MQLGMCDRIMITFVSPVVDCNRWTNASYTTICASCTFGVEKCYGRRLLVNVDNAGGIWFNLLDTSLWQPVFEDAVVLSIEPDIEVEPCQMEVVGQSDVIAQDFDESDVIAQDLNNKMDISLEQWNLKSEFGGVDMESIWIQYGKGSGSVVAVLDSGIAYNSASMFQTILPGYDFISNPINSRDSDGRDSDFWDPGDADGINCMTSSWHGTAMASIVMAKTQIGYFNFHGIASDAAILPIRVLGRCSRGSASDVADAIVWAAGATINGVDTNQFPSTVIMMAFAGNGPCPTFLQSSVYTAISRGAILLAAAGNDGGQTSINFPANCIGVRSIGASTKDGRIASYSNKMFHFKYPGGDEVNAIPVITEGLRYVKVIGTSAAVAHAAGTAACNRIAFFPDSNYVALSGVYSIEKIL